MFVTVFLSVVGGIILLLGGAYLAIHGDAKSVQISKYSQGRIDIQKKLAFTEGLQQTFHFEGTDIHQFKHIGTLRANCTLRHFPNKVIRVNFHVKNIAYIIPKESQTSPKITCYTSKCKVLVGLSPCLGTEFKEGFIGNTKVRFHKVHHQSTYPIEDSLAMNQTILILKGPAFKRLWIKPIHLLVKGIRSIYFTNANVANHTEEEEYQVAVTNQMGILFGFYTFQDVPKP